MEQPVFEGAVGGLTRGFEDRAVGAEQPAVIATADALVFNAAVEKTRAAMDATRIQQSRAALAITEKHELLTENVDFPRQVGHLG
jgi:hypothetical protein